MVKGKRNEAIKGLIVMWNQLLHTRNLTDKKISEYQTIISNAIDALQDMPKSAQDPVEPENDEGVYICGNCSEPVEFSIQVNGTTVHYEHSNFCGNCGKPVKWG